MESSVSTTTLPKRSELALDATWALDRIYPTNELWEEDFRRVEAMVAALEEHRGGLGQSAATLLIALRARDELNMTLERLVAYARMRRDEDNANTTYQALTDRAMSLATRAGAAESFFEPEILEIDDARIEAFLAQDEDLSLYRHHLEELRRQREHIRTAEIEELLAQAGEIGRAPGTIFTMLNNADLTFPTIVDEHGEPVELTKGRYIRLLESQDRRVRQDAFAAMYETYGKLRNTIGATLASSVKRDVFYARARRYESSLAAALEPSNIPLSVYHNLLAAVDDNLPHLHRYLRLRRRLLGLDDLHMWDLYVPMVAEAQRDIPWEEATATVAASLAPLGQEYVAVVREGLSTRWVDVYENAGKTSGAYSYGTYTTHPYILMNYQPTLDAVFTLTHEFGHALHSYYSRGTQPYVYSGYTIFLAEVASTLNEALLTHHLLAGTTDRRFRMALINRFLEAIRTTLYRQAMFAGFELQIHEQAERGEALTPEWLNTTYAALNERYYGAEVVIDEPIALEWARIPHFYRAFYVYQYATGIAAAVALSQQILNEGEPAVRRYKEFLSSGSADYSIPLLQRAGVDMTSPAPVRQALDTFGRLVTELEELAAQDG